MILSSHTQKEKPLPAMFSWRKESWESQVHYCPFLPYQPELQYSTNTLTLLYPRAAPTSCQREGPRLSVSMPPNNPLIKEHSRPASQEAITYFAKLSPCDLTP